MERAGRNFCLTDTVIKRAARRSMGRTVPPPRSTRPTSSHGWVTDMTAQQFEKAFTVLAGELAESLREHRADMHEASSRPCSTCSKSTKVLAKYDRLLEISRNRAGQSND